VIDLLNLRLREEAPPNVSILNMAATQREVGTKRWADELAWTRYRQHPATEALPELAEAYMSHVRAILGESRKVLVTDLDNTLWKGVIGEDGLDGIGVGPGSPEGEAHLHLQRYMLDLKRRGILLAVCSKNNLEDAQLPFLQHPHMALRLEDFAAFRANWEDKVVNLRAMARDLSLGLDSFVFLDDNPLEREWVRSQLPEVAIIELGSSPFHYLHQLDRGHYFEALSLSGEDLARADQYRVEAQRESMRASSASLEDFLQKLQLEASVETITAKNLARVTQLVNKTNQFNVTTRRYTEAQLCAITEDPQGWARAFQMSDRMGSYGLIGVLCCRSADRCGTWEIDTWLMSCRTLGRQMEKFMFDRLIEAAIERRVGRIVGVYRPTAKNGLVKELYDQMGFRRSGESGDEVRYELDVPATPVVTATHVRNLTASAKVTRPRPAAGCITSAM
jgi:FkbH-like protein